MYICIGSVVLWGAWYWCPGLPTWLEICLDLFFISCINILKKDVNVQVKLTSSFSGKGQKTKSPKY